MRPRRERLGYTDAFGLPSWGSGGFNEAEARTPRIPKGGNHAILAQLPASMRPRRERLGYTTVAKTRFRQETRFNEAEARTPRIREAVVKLPPRHARSFNEAEARTPRIQIARHSRHLGLQLL